MERNVAEIDMGVGLARVVGDDRDDVHRQFADAPAIEQIDEAMVEARDQDQRALACRRAARIDQSIAKRSAIASKRCAQRVERRAVGERCRTRRA